MSSNGEIGVSSDLVTSESTTSSASSSSYGSPLDVSNSIYWDGEGGILDLRIASPSNLRHASNISELYLKAAIIVDKVQYKGRLNNPILKLILKINITSGNPNSNSM